MNIGEKIKKIRLDKSLTLKDLAEKIGIHFGSLSNIEKGTRNPSLDILEKIADALEVSIDRLTGETLSSIIEDRINELGITLEEVAKEAKVSLYWLKNLDSFIPGEMDDVKEPHELGWNDTIGWYKSYDQITRVAKVLDLPGATLRAALARQEIPRYDGPISSVEEDFAAEYFSEYFATRDNTEKNLLKHFNKLNKTGKKEAIKRVEELTCIDKYTIKENPNLHLLPNAAHEIEGASEEDKAHDDELMDDDNF